MGKIFQNESNEDGISWNYIVILHEKKGVKSTKQNFSWKLN